MDGESEAYANSDLTCASHSAAPHLAGREATGLVRRRHERWPTVERARITAESFAPGTSVSEVARRSGVSLGLLHEWRRQARVWIGAKRRPASANLYLLKWSENMRACWSPSRRRLRPTSPVNSNSFSVP